HRHIRALYRYIGALYRHMGALHRYIWVLHRHFQALHRRFGALHRLFSQSADRFSTSLAVFSFQPSTPNPMPAPLTWDTPGITYDSGATWDGTAATPKRESMSNTKAIIDFSRYNAGALGPIAHNIHDKMLANAATFTAPPIDMTALQTQC